MTCEVCDQPTASKYGVCNRTLECKQEQRRRRYQAGHPDARDARDHRPCKVCGLPTISKTGVCSRTSKCKSTSQGHTPQEMSACEVCGRSTTSAFRVCRQTKECDNEWARRRYVGADPAVRAVRAEAKRRADRNRYGADPDRYRAADQQWYAANREKAAQATRKYHAAHPEVLLAIKRRYMQRADRPCRYVKAGCIEFALINDVCCREHRKSDRRRHKERKRTRLIAKLATAQDWICPWCDLPLPEDLAGVHIDHIIPKASGFIIEDEWNLQALHHPCNARKFDMIIPQALALAAEHGIPLAA